VQVHGFPLWRRIWGCTWFLKNIFLSGTVRIWSCHWWCWQYSWVCFTMHTNWLLCNSLLNLSTWHNHTRESAIANAFVILKNLKLANTLSKHFGDEYTDAQSMILTLKSAHVLMALVGHWVEILYVAITCDIVRMLTAHDATNTYADSKIMYRWFCFN
jgi:hypothetical protein